MLEQLSSRATEGPPALLSEWHQPSSTLCPGLMCCPWGEKCTTSFPHPSSCTSSQVNTQCNGSTSQIAGHQAIRVLLAAAASYALLSDLAWIACCTQLTCTCTCKLGGFLNHISARSLHQLLLQAKIVGVRMTRGCLAGPLAPLYYSGQFVPLIVFFLLFLAIVKNNKLHHFVRFNCMQVSTCKLSLLASVVSACSTYQVRRLSVDITWCTCTWWIEQQSCSSTTYRSCRWQLEDGCSMQFQDRAGWRAVMKCLLQGT